MNHLYLRVIVPLAITLPLFFAFFNIRRLSAAEKVMFMYLLVSAIVNAAGAIISANHRNNLPLLHIFTVVEFALIIIFYKKILEDGKYTKQYTALMAVFIILCVINALFFQSIYIYNSYTRSIEAIIIMLFSVNYFAKLFVQYSDVQITAIPSFWFNTGIFLYFSWSFMFFIFSNVVAKQSSSNGNVLLYIHASFVLVMYVLFAVGFYKVTHKKVPNGDLFCRDLCKKSF
jgi:hypothetical protein